MSLSGGDTRCRIVDLNWGGMYYPPSLLPPPRTINQYSVVMFSIGIHLRV